MSYIVKLIKSRTIAEGTMEFRFEKPTTGPAGKPPGFIYKPGQNADWTLINPGEIHPTDRRADAESNKRTFSFVSAPYEPELIITTRMRDTAFKRVLKSLEPGAEIVMEGPYGDMTLHHDETRPAVFLAGGIGITPFMSIVRQALHDMSPIPLTLFYSNRRPEDTAFLTELEGYDAEGGTFRLVATMTDATTSREAWEDETGHIDAEMLHRYLDDLAEPIYYLAGPPKMTAGLQKMLNDAGVNPDSVRTEEFAGY